MAGMAGAAPAAMTMARVESSALFTATVHGEVMRAWPSRTSTPIAR